MFVSRSDACQEGGRLVFGRRGKPLMVNQLLLLLANSRSRARPDPTHPFGYGMEIYFWTFVVAVLVLLAGGGASLWEDIHHLVAPKPLVSAGLSLGVLCHRLLKG